MSVSGVLGLLARATGNTATFMKLLLYWMFQQLEFQLDNLRQVRPRYITHQTPPVQEGRRRRIHLQLLPLGDLGVYLRRGGPRVHALPQLSRVQMLPLCPLQHLRPQIVDLDLRLMLENPVVIVPERRGVLPEHAARGDGGRLGPRMQRFEREIREHYPQVFRELDRRLLPNLFGFFPAHRALEVAEDRERQRCARRSEGRLIVQLQQVEIRLERTVVDIVRGSAEDG